MNAVSLNYLWQLIKTLDKNDRDRRFLEELWSLPIDDSKTVEQKIQDVEKNRMKGIIRDLDYAE